MSLIINEIQNGDNSFNITLSVADKVRKYNTKVILKRFVATPNLTKNNERTYTLSSDFESNVGFSLFGQNEMYNITGDFNKDKQYWCRVLFQQPSSRMMKTKDTIFNVIKSNEEYIKYDLRKLIYDNLESGTNEDNLNSFLNNLGKELNNNQSLNKIESKLLEFKDKLTYVETKDLLDNIIKEYYNSENLDKITYRRGNNINDIILPYFECENEIGQIVIIMSKFRYEILNNKLQMAKKFDVSLPKELLKILYNNDWGVIRGNSFKHNNSMKNEQMQLF